MCLAVPGRIIQIKSNIDELFRTGIVSFDGVNKEVSLAMLPEAQVDDYVLVHVGVALSIVNETEALETITALKTMGSYNPDEA